MIKKIGLGLGILALLALAWYLFFKPYDYLVRFNVKTFPGPINQSVKLWHKSSLSLPLNLIEGESITNFTQKIKFGDSTNIYHWKIAPLTDSTSRIKVYVKDVDHSFKNKLTIPFKDTEFEKRTRKTLLDFNTLLTEHIENFKVEIDEGVHEVKSTYYAYIPIECHQLEKAGGMMRNFNYLSGTLLDHQVQLKGLPFNYVTHWNMDTDSIAYNFSYPIIRSDRLPTNTDIKYKRLFAKKAIKATYYGNYLTSDRAWYILYDYAKKNNIEVELTPIEVFHNNPNLGDRDHTWKTDVYLPIKEKLDE